jgi:chromosome segregation ATPase
VDEELGELQEQIAAARAEIDALQNSAADAEARAQTARAEADGLCEQLRYAQASTDAAAGEASALREQLARSDERASAAAARYRELVVRAEPAVPADLVTGDTVEEIDASLEAARSVVGRVRTHMEEQAQSVRVPVGAPQRGSPDLGALTPEQKIRYGLGQRET